MNGKNLKNYQPIFDHYTRLGVLITFSLCMINGIVVLDFSSKLKIVAFIAFVVDVISPFWVPLFFYLMNKQIDDRETQKTFKRLSLLTTAAVMGIYSILFSGLIDKVGIIK
jgi:hypothetical protein